MRIIRAFEAEQVFEQTWAGRASAADLVDVAQRAARRGDEDAVQVCLAKLRRLDPDTAAELARELTELIECVRRHPAGRARPQRRAAP